MRVKITEQGVPIPKEWLMGSDEAIVYRDGGRIVVRLLKGPIAEDDPIWDLGKNPIRDDDITDGSVNLDKYLY